jgi:hypothetical protein
LAFTWVSGCCDVPVSSKPKVTLSACEDCGISNTTHPSPHPSRTFSNELSKFRSGRITISEPTATSGGPASMPG